VPKGCADGEGELRLRGQPANPGSSGKMAVKTECVFITSVIQTGDVLVLAYLVVLEMAVVVAVRRRCCWPRRAMGLEE